MTVVRRGDGPWRLGPRARRWFDAVLATTLVLGSSVMISIGVAALLLSLAQTIPLYLRRVRPATTFTLVAAASVAQAVLGQEPIWGQLAFPVALYSLARYGRPLQGWLGLGTGLAGAATASIVWTRSFNTDVPLEYRGDLEWTSYLPMFLTIGAIVIAAWALGTQSRVRVAYEATLLERGQQLAAEAEQRALMAATDERSRIAREMHDVVAHGLSVVIVQADGARYAAAQDPQVAVDTLGTVAEAGRDALGEMRRLLGLLRGTTDPGLAPQPGLGDLPDLLAAEVETGRVVVHLPDPAPKVSSGVGLTVFRLVQEALTNVRKHAGATATTTVRLRATSGFLEVEVVDDGHGAASGEGSGLGLLGMRERVEVHDGTLVVGPEPGGGWAVRARIPQ
ncbi:sensor histidine kinase [Aeromicrobium sp. CF4.19]|uniref:sensor histidine kinase n=1 Tax=Aeromicrobium sp. CF4.19 TaxID=3373082 RepID=UPI003EE7ABD0